MKTLWTTAALIGLVAFTGGPTYAQPPALRAPVALPPAYSPYLNLLRNGNPAYINYYGLVRPEVDARNQIYGLQQGVAANATAISTIDTASGLPLTGHPTQFLNTSHYFLNRGGQGTSAAAPGSMVQAATRPTRPGH